VKDPKVGERAAYYHVYGRLTGKITRVDGESGEVLLYMDHPWNNDVQAHPKQLRRLIPNPERWSLQEIGEAWNVLWRLNRMVTTFNANNSLAEDLRAELRRIAGERVKTKEKK
jgi:hypothetical protein